MRAADAFLSELALMTTVGEDTAEEEDPGELLVLSSVHQAKGLEWKVVFVLWLVEEFFPSGLALRESGEDEEERRLFYVAVTRAKKNLYLCYPLLEMDRHRTGTLTRPSRFLKELPETVYEQWTIEEDFFGDPEESEDGGGNGRPAGSRSRAGGDDRWMDEHFEQRGPADF